MLSVSDEALRALLAEATKAQERSHSPYSGIRIGCAIVDEQGRTFCGTNIENASFGLSLCAERVAAAVALMAGSKKWKAMAVISDSRRFVPPCGACLQVLSEFCTGDFEIIWGNHEGTPESATLADLLSRPCRLQGG
jgi:cytidine deaminase